MRPLTRTRASVVLLATLLAGCALPTEPVLLYDPAEVSEDEVVVLLSPYPRGILMVLRVDGEIAGGACMTNCVFVTPAHVAPGAHRFQTSNMQVPGLATVTSAIAFDFEAELEAGKTYELRVRALPKEKGERSRYDVWWQEVRP